MTRPNSGGYILILVAAALPVLLLGVKYVIDRATLDSVGIEKVQSAKIYKQCAKKAALEVAKQWNPGLTLAQQKETALRVADDVYNMSPVHDDSVLGRAIPGLDKRSDFSARQGGSIFQALELSIQKNALPELIVEYEEVEGPCLRFKAYSNTYDIILPIFQLYDAVYRMQKDSRFVQEDVGWDASFTYAGPHPYITIRQENLSNFTAVAHGSKVASQASVSALKYKKRLEPNDNKVQVTINNNRIRVLTDDDVDFAIPAECNVDIVLTIPTNGAASNVDNRDKNSPTAGSCYTSSGTTPTADARKTPIYQIAQAYRTFLKENFLYTRGVNVGLVPYSGNCSLPEAKLAGWTEQPKKFVKNYFLENSKIYPARLKGVFLYGTMSKALSGGEKLDFQHDHCGRDSHSITSIMCRTGKFSTEAAYGNNILCHGNLLSTVNPANAASEAYSPKYRRKPAANCHICYADLLSMKGEKDFPVSWYSFNPYHIAELQADVMRICDLLNLFYPFNLASNSCSNFIFIGPEWANNLFQNWTNDPRCDAINSVGNSPTGGQLSRPSKTTSGRKKALIMLVNKPDWFEPQELTYLGFDNDFSEMPKVESDKIDFRINYGDTSRKFLDGSAYNGTIAGPRKILTYSTTSGTVERNPTSGYYECTSNAASGRLSFPEKYLVKIVVEKAMATLNNWKRISTDLNSISSSGWQYHNITYGNGKFIAVNSNGYVAYSSDAVTWFSAGNPLSNFNKPYWHGGTCYGANKFVAVNSNGYVAYSLDGINWTLEERQFTGSLWNGGICYGNGKFIILGESSTLPVSTDGIIWSLSSNIDSSSYNWRGGIAYGNGRFVAANRDNKTAYSSDGINWVLGGNLSSIHNWYVGLCYAGSEFIVMNSQGYINSSVDGESWTSRGRIPASIASTWEGGICYARDNLYALSSNGYVAKYTVDNEISGTLKFNNITSSQDQIDAGPHTVAERTTLYVEASQIADTKDANGNHYVDLDMENIRLISAEITNASYDKITPVTVSYNDVDILDATKGQTASEFMALKTVTTTEPPATDTIDFAAGKTAGGVMSYSTVSGSATYNSKRGLVCNGSGRISFSQRPTSDVTLVVGEVASQTPQLGIWSKISADLENISSTGWDNYGRVGYDGAGKLIAVNTDGTIASSSDGGVTWTKITKSDDNGWRGVSYGNGKWITVSGSGIVATSVDGIEWVNHGKNGSGSNGLADINGEWYGPPHYEDGKWIIVNSQGYIGASTDGIIWDNYGKNGTGSNGLVNIYSENWYGGVYHGNGTWLTVNSWGHTALSSDAKSWTSNGNTTLKNIKNGYWRGAFYANNKWLTINTYGYVASSTDNGKNWISHGNNGTNNNGLANIRSELWKGGAQYIDGKWLTVNHYGDTAVCYDIVGDTKITVGSGSAQTISGQTTITIPASSLIQSGSSYYIDLGMTYVCLISATIQYEKPKTTTTSLTISRPGTVYLTKSLASHLNSGTCVWQSQGKQLSSFGSDWSYYGNSVVYAKGKFIVINNGGVVASSGDGISWSKIGNVGARCYGACFGNGYFASLANSNNFYYSTDAVTWTKGTAPPGTYYDDDITYGAGKFLTTSDGPNVQVLTDITGSWSSAGANLSSVFSGDLNRLTYGAGKFLIYNPSSGKTALSPDGVTWTAASTLKSCSAFYPALDYDDNMFVFLHGDGYVAYSEDGINWTYQGGSSATPLQTATNQKYWSGIAYGGGKWVAVNSSGYVATTSGTETSAVSTSQLTTDAEGNYKMEMADGSTVSWAVFHHSVTETVDDIIVFADGTTSKNPCHYLSASVSGSKNAMGLFVPSSSGGQLTVARPGSVALTVAPVLGTADNTFQFTSGPDTAAKTISGVQTLTIPTSTMTKNGDSYSCSFAMGNIALIKAKFTADSRVKYLAPPRPEMSRVVDFSVDDGGKPLFGSGSVAYGESTSNLGKAGVEFDENLGYWVTKDSGVMGYIGESGYNQFFNKNIEGDFYCLMEDVGAAPPLVFWSDKNNFGSTVDAAGTRLKTARYLGGLSRMFMPFGVYHPNDYAWTNIYDCNAGVKEKMIYGGFTWPVNAVLYMGASGETLHQYQWQGDDAGNISIAQASNASNACARVTKSACDKLKADWGANLRIYVIRYRRQTSYRHKISGIEEPFDYSYLDDCASGSSYVYDAANEADLKSALSTIAKDIKEFAGYVAAKNVE